MAERLLSERNLTDLVCKLVKIPIGEFSRRDESYTVYPSGPDSLETEHIKPKIVYRVSLECFSIVLEATNGMYSLKLKKSGLGDGCTLDSEYEPAYNYRTGKIGKLFTLIEKQFKQHAKEEEGKSRNLRRLETVIF